MDCDFAICDYIVSFYILGEIEDYARNGPSVRSNQSCENLMFAISTSHTGNPWGFWPLTQRWSIVRSMFPHQILQYSILGCLIPVYLDCCFGIGIGIFHYMKIPTFLLTLTYEYSPWQWSLVPYCAFDSCRINLYMILMQFEVGSCVRTLQCAQALVRIHPLLSS